MTKPSTSLTFPKGYEKIMARKLNELRALCGNEYVGDTDYAGLSAWLQRIAVKGKVVDCEELSNLAARERIKTAGKRYLIVIF